MCGAYFLARATDPLRLAALREGAMFFFRSPTLFLSGKFSAGARFKSFSLRWIRFTIVLILRGV